jgi:hypothetical protein
MLSTFAQQLQAHRAMDARPTLDLGGRDKEQDCCYREGGEAGDARYERMLGGHVLSPGPTGLEHRRLALRLWSENFVNHVGHSAIPDKIFPDSQYAINSDISVLIGLKYQAAAPLRFDLLLSAEIRVVEHRTFDRVVAQDARDFCRCHSAQCVLVSASVGMKRVPS